MWNSARDMVDYASAMSWLLEKGMLQPYCPEPQHTVLLTNLVNCSSLLWQLVINHRSSVFVFCAFKLCLFSFLEPDTRLAHPPFQLNNIQNLLKQRAANQFPPEARLPLQWEWLVRSKQSEIINFFCCFYYLSMITKC